MDGGWNMSTLETLGTAVSAVAYQRIVLEEILAGRYVAAWTPLEIQRGGRNLRIEVLGRPLAVGSAAAPVYVMASATLQQVIADALDALLPTSLVLDEIHRQATARIPPITQGEWVTDRTMGLPHRLAEQSETLRTKIAAQANAALLSDAWKTWALAKGMKAAKMLEGSEQAFNHGLYTPSATSVTLGGEHAIQVLGGAHGRYHIDYSQVVILMRGECVLDGAPMRTANVLRDPGTAALLSDEGALTVTRQPGRFDESTFLTSSPPGGDGALARPVLRRGSKGDAVRSWQAIVGAKVDGDFGPKTETATRVWQAARHLVADGIVGRHSWAAAIETTPTPEPTRALEGIDISSNQGHVRFEQVKADGIDLVYLRASDGVNWTDAEFYNYAAAAKAEGLPLGAYHYLRARPDADEQARQFVDRFRRAGCTLLPMIDIEPENNKGKKSPEWLEAILKFSNVVEQAFGKKPFAYSYPGFLDAMTAFKTSAELGAHPLWIADYSLERPVEPWVPAPWTRWVGWQYAAGDHRGRVGRVKGVTTDVDRNHFRTTLDELTVEY